MSTVAITRNKNVKDSIRSALEILEDVPSRIKGKYVAIKPNDTWASEDDTTACTQADTLEAVIQYVKRFQPSRIVVSGGAGAAETEDVFRLLGLDRVIRQEGVEFFDHNRPPFVSVQLRHGPQREVRINPHIQEYETVISLAQHKVHYEATVTLTMKNIAMSFPAADYYGHPRGIQKHPNYFYRDMQGFIAGMCQRFPPRIGIIVGHPAMVNRGPIGGLTFETEMTIAGTDFVAVDAVGASILGYDEVGHIQQAAELGLGTADLDKIDIVGIPLDEARTIFNTQRESATPREASPSGVWVYSHR